MGEAAQDPRTYRNQKHWVRLGPPVAVDLLPDRMPKVGTNNISHIDSSKGLEAVRVQLRCRPFGIVGGLFN